MREIKFEIITLEWQKEKYESVPSSSGIYQIYGTSPVYGVDTLLYIGQAENLNVRLRQHFDNHEGVIGRQPNKTCRFALLSKDLLTIVEETLIIMHKPSFNSARLINVSSHTKARPVYIQNHGERGLLSMETTNYYFLGEKEVKEDQIAI